MIDFAIYIDTKAEQPSGPVMSAIKRVRELLPAKHINHCSSLGLRNSPLYVAIESKRQGDGGMESLLQIQVWLGAHLNFLVSTAGLVRKAAGGGAEATDSPEQLGLSECPFLPALIVQGPDWQFVALKSENENTVSHSFLPLLGPSVLSPFFASWSPAFGLIPCVCCDRQTSVQYALPILAAVC